MELIPTSVEKVVLSKKDAALIKAGITDEVVMSSLAEHLGACEVRRDWDSEKKEWIETKVPMWQVQEKAQEKVVRIKGWAKEESGSSVVVKNINISAEEFRRLLDEDRKVKRGGQTGEIVDVQGYK